MCPRSAFEEATVYILSVAVLVSPSQYTVQRDIHSTSNANSAIELLS